MSCNHESTPKLEIGYDQNSISFPKLNSLQSKRGLSKNLNPYWEEREDKIVINFQSMKV
jgi:hypothetical protein